MGDGEGDGNGEIGLGASNESGAISSCPAPLGRYRCSSALVIDMSGPSDACMSLNGVYRSERVGVYVWQV